MATNLGMAGCCPKRIGILQFRFKIFNDNILATFFKFDEDWSSNAWEITMAETNLADTAKNISN